MSERNEPRQGQVPGPPDRDGSFEWIDPPEDRPDRLAEAVWLWLLSPTEDADDGYQQARGEIAWLLGKAGYFVHQYPHIPDPRAEKAPGAKPNPDPLHVPELDPPRRSGCLSVLPWLALILVWVLW